MSTRIEAATKLITKNPNCASCYATCPEEELGCPDCYTNDCTRHQHYECRDCPLNGVEW